MTAAPPATLTAATAAAALMATPPAKSPPPVADAAPAPVPTPAATVLAPTTVPAPATTGTVAALAVPAPSRPLRSESGIGISMSPRKAVLWRFWRRANCTQSGHSARWSRSLRRSLRPRRPSTDFEMASWASVHVSCCSSSSVSERRARKSRVSSAPVVTPRIPAISAYERPSNSRRTIAWRCWGGIFASAVRSSPTLGPSSSASRPAILSSSSTVRGRACSCRKRCLIVLLAIVSSQFDGFRGRTPCSSERYALRKVVCVTSSASAWLPRTAYA